MATVRELQAKFSATASGMKSTIQGIKNNFDDLGKKSENAAKKISTGFQNTGKKMQGTGKSMSKYITAPLVAIGAAGFAAANDIDKAYKEIRTGSGATGEDLEDLKDSFDTVFSEVPASASDVANSLADLNTFTGATGKVLEGLTKQTLDAANALGEDGPAASAAFGKALNGWNVPAEEGAEHLDHLFTLGQNYGVGLTELSNDLSKHGSVMRNAGFEMDETADLFARLESNGISVSRVMPGLNSAFRNWADEGKNTREEFDKVIRKMQDTGSETEQLAIAQEVFGAQGAQRIVDAVNNDALPALEELGEGFDDAGGAVEENTEATRTFGDRMMILKNNVQQALQPIGEIMLDLAERWLPPVIAGVQKLTDWFKGLGPVGQQVIFAIGAIAAAIGPLLVVGGMFVGWIGNAIGALAPLIGRIKNAGGIMKVFGKGIRTLAGRFSFLLGPIGIAIGVITTLASIFTLAYKNSETFRAGIDKIVNAVKFAFENFGDIIKGIKGLFQDDGQAGRDILTSLGLSEDFVMKLDNIAAKISYFKGFIINFIEGFKGLFSGDGSEGRDLLSAIGLSDGAVDTLDDIAMKLVDFRDKAVDAFQAVVSFLKEKISEIKAFWDDNGQQILQSFQNIFTGIWNVVSPILNFIVDAVVWAFPYIQKVIGTALKIAFEIVKMIWSNIQGVINGALDIIMGLVQTFSGLFTGDFSKMWEGIKDVFFGSIEFVWNLVQLMFWGRLIKGVAGFVRSFSGFFSSMWQGIRNIFSTVINWIGNFVRNSWNRISTTTTNVFTSISNFISRIWNGILSFFRNVITNIFNRVRNGFNQVRDTTTSIFTRVRDFLRDTWQKIYNGIRNSVSNIFNRVRDAWNNVRSKTVEIFNNVKTKITDIFTDIVDAAKNLPKRIGDGIGKMASKVTNGVKKVTNKLAETLGKGVNGVISGINWVLEKIGVGDGDFIDEWPVPKFARGGTHEGGLAVLGDGGKHELFQTPDGDVGLSPNKDTLMNLPKGTSILSGEKTNRLFDAIPRYKDGTDDQGFLGNVWDGAKDLGGKVKDGVVGAGKKVGEWAGNVWEYVKEPSKLLDIALKTLGVVIPKGGSFIGDFAKAGFTKAKDFAVDFVKDKLDIFSSSEPSGGSGAQKWAGVATNALQMTGQYTQDNLDRLLMQMQSESGGNPKAINLWDSNAKRGIPSKGLMQVIDPTFRAYRMPGFTDIWNPLDNILASIRYAVSRYGSLSSAYRGVGYEKGGIINKEHEALVGEGNKEEAIIPLEQHRSRAIGLWHEVGRRLGISDQTMAVLYNSQDGVVDMLRQVLDSIGNQTQEIINQNPFLQRMVEDVKRARNFLSSQLEEAKQGIQEGMQRNKAEILQNEDSNSAATNRNVNQSKDSIVKDISSKVTSGISTVTDSVNEMGNRISQAVGQSISKLETKIQAVDKKATQAQQSAKKSSNSNSLQSRISKLIQKRGEPARKHFQVIEEDGDWLNDWSHTGNKKADKPYLLAGYEYAKSLGQNLGRYANKHLERVKGYAGGGIVDTKQLAWIAEGGWAESIISHDPAKRAGQERIWQQTGDRLGFNDGKGNKEMLDELRRIANAVETGDAQVVDAINRKPVLSEGDIKRSYDKVDSSQSINHGIFTGRPGGA